MSAHSSHTKNNRAPRTPYVPPAARDPESTAGKTSDALSFGDGEIRNDDRPTPMGEEETASLQGADVSRRRLEGTGAGHKAKQGKISNRRRNERAAVDGGAAPPATKTTKRAVGTTGKKLASTPTAPDGRPSAATPTAKAAKSAATGETEPENKRTCVLEEACDDFNRQCCVESAPDDRSICQATPPTSDLANTGPPPSAAVGTRCAPESQATSGQSKRKPRQAWAQYVPPGRRGPFPSASSTRVEQPEEASAAASTTSRPITHSAAEAIASPPARDAESNTPAADHFSKTVRTRSSSTKRTAKAFSPQSTKVNPSAVGRDGTGDTKPLETESAAQVKNEEGNEADICGSWTASVEIKTVEGSSCATRRAESEGSRVTSQRKQPAPPEQSAANVARTPYVAPALRDGATGAQRGNSRDSFGCGVVNEGVSDATAGVIPNPNSVKKNQVGAGVVPKAEETTLPSESSADSMDMSTSEDGQVSARSAPSPRPLLPAPPPPPSPVPAGSHDVIAEGGSRLTGEHQVQIETQPAATAETELGTDQTPAKGSGNRRDNAEGVESSSSIACEKNEHGDDQEKTPTKSPFSRYIPPGRRKILDAEAAANGAGGGMGPLWTSRAPVRVSQRARPSDGDASPARPSPSRVAGVVTEGMSAYGANISEYSEQMPREKLEACTAMVSNFPSALPPGQRESMLQSFISLGALIVWPRPDEALVTFATPALARQAVSSKHNRSTVLAVELLSGAREERRQGYRRVELARPGRPPADISSASRLISGALGIRRPRVKPSGAPTRKGTTSSSSKGGVRGRGAKDVQPAESTDSWDM